MITDRTVVLSATEFTDLREYSCSFPTGTTIGKRWKCDDSKYKRPAPKPNWWMAEYVEHEDPELVGIKWSRIIHKCRAEGCDLPTWSERPGGHCSPHVFMLGDV